MLCLPLTQKLESQVSSRRRELGYSYFSRGRVEIIEGNATAVDAVVCGEDFYQVFLWAEGTSLRVHCICPFYQDWLTACKHIWAALLEAQKKNFLSCFDDIHKVQVLPFLEEIDGPISEQFSSAKQSPVLSWKEDLFNLKHDLRQQEADRFPATAAENEVVYLLDAPEIPFQQKLTLEVAFRERKIDGNPGKIKRSKIRKEWISHLPCRDQQILTLLAGFSQNAYYGYNNSLDGHYSIPSYLTRSLLPLLCETGRFFLWRDAGESGLARIHWENGEPWKFSLEFFREPGRILANGVLCRGSEKMDISHPWLLIPGGGIFFQDRAALLEDSGTFGWLKTLHRKKKIEISEMEWKDFLFEFFSLPDLPPFKLPQGLDVNTISVSPAPKLRVQSSQLSRQYRPVVSGSLSFVYDGVAVPFNDPRPFLFEKDTGKLLERKQSEEKDAQAFLFQLGFKAKARNGDEGWEMPASRFANGVKSLVEKGWQVEADGKLFRNPRAFSMQVSTGIDWFELNGKVDFEGIPASFPRVIEALRRRENTMILDDGSIGILPETWLERYGLLSSLGEVENGRVKFSRSQVGFLDALLAAQPEIDCDEAFSRVREKLKNFNGIKEAAPPSEFKGQLRDYQRTGLGWLSLLQDFSFGGILADDMGLGKTVQVLALLASRKKSSRSPSLVVVPKSLIFNWVQEAKRFAPHLRVLDHTGLAREKDTRHFSRYDLILTTYGTLRRDIHVFKDFSFDYVILDESQAIKNAKSESSKAVRLLSGSHRLALTGTPIENHLGELWSQLEFLNPGMLGKSSRFQELLGMEFRNPPEETRAFAARALRPFILRRKKEEVARELPARTEQIVYCELEGKQKEMYEELRGYYRASLLADLDEEGMAKAKIQILEALLRLRQAACHPGLIDPRLSGEGCAKLDAFLPQVLEVLEEGHKVLVFSQFTKFLAILRKKLDKEKIRYEYLDGKTADRKTRVDRFEQDPGCKLFLISLKAGGFGLNLTSAEYVFLLDPWWNPAVEDQAIDRAHRIGQTRPVFAYRLIAKDTVEEKVLALQESKRELARTFMENGDSLIRTLTRQDLELLLS